MRRRSPTPSSCPRRAIARPRRLRTSSVPRRPRGARNPEPARSRGSIGRTLGRYPAGSFDHRGAGSSDPHVEVRLAPVEYAERREDPLDEAEPPVLHDVLVKLRELGIEVLALMKMLGREAGHQHGNAVDHGVLRAAERATRTIPVGYERSVAAGTHHSRWGQDGLLPPGADEREGIGAVARHRARDDVPEPRDRRADPSGCVDVIPRVVTTNGEPGLLEELTPPF